MTIADRYNAEAARLLPHMADRLAVEPTIITANEIDEIVFGRSEYLGGMACAILAMLEQRDHSPRHVHCETIVPQWDL